MQRSTKAAKGRSRIGIMDNGPCVCYCRSITSSPGSCRLGNIKDRDSRTTRTVDFVVAELYVVVEVSVPLRPAQVGIVLGGLQRCKVGTGDLSGHFRERPNGYIVIRRAILALTQCWCIHD